MPFAGKKGLIATRFQNRCDGPFSLRQAAALALKGHCRHAAPVGDASSHNRGATGSAAGLAIKGAEGHAFVGHAVEIRRGLAAAFAAGVSSEISPADVVANDEDDVWLAARACASLG